MQTSTLNYTADEFFSLGSGIVTLCGSTKFFYEAMEASRRLTFKNWAVFMCGSWGHSYHKYAVADNKHCYPVVKMLHFQKILRSQAVVVVSDKTTYYGDSTKAEIAFAKDRNLPVFLFDGENFSGVTEYQPPQQFLDTALIQHFETKYGSLGF